MELYTYHRGILWYIHYISATLFFKIKYYVISRYAYKEGSSYSQNHTFALIFNKHTLPLIDGILLWESKARPS